MTKEKALEIIEFCKKTKLEALNAELQNSQILTTLSEAYCEVENWNKALVTCFLAFIKQYGVGSSYDIEKEDCSLSMIYNEIKQHISSSISEDNINKHIDKHYKIAAKKYQESFNS